MDLAKKLNTKTQLWAHFYLKTHQKDNEGMKHITYIIINNKNFIIMRALDTNQFWDTIIIKLVH